MIWTFVRIQEVFEKKDESPRKFAYLINTDADSRIFGGVFFVGCWLFLWRSSQRVLVLQDIEFSCVPPPPTNINPELVT